MLKKDHLLKICEPILILGESGTGKTRLAKWIHQNSWRSQKPFIHLNIASLSEQLFESELFGHKRGSFTGALIDKKGFCEEVGDGILFLDEIGELRLSLQKKLLTLVEEGVYYPVGSTQKRKFQGTIIFATNKDLVKLVAEGKFREDLYYRICGFTYSMPPLRQNIKIEEMVKSKFEKEKAKMGKPNLQMTKSVKDFLENYDYPGNLRELSRIMKYLVFVAEKNIEIEDLPNWLNQEKTDEKAKKSSDNYYDALENFEKHFIRDKLRKYRGRINHTAEKINISKVTLISKIKKYDINIPSLKLEFY